MTAAIRLLVVLLIFSTITCKETDTIYQPVDLLTDPSVRPSVIYTFPGTNSVGPYDGFNQTVTVRFNKLMDLPSLRRSVHFESPMGDIRPDTSIISINQGDVATITPIPSMPGLPFRWRVGKEYVLRVDSSARDINGNMFYPPYRLKFTPEPWFRVKNILPASGAVNVGGASIQIGFNAAVDSSLGDHIRISPSVEGLWRFPAFNPLGYDSSRISFQTKNGFVADTTYWITLDDGATDAYGDSLVEKFSSSFSTVSFGITGTYPSDGTTEWSPYRRSIYIYFSDSLDTSTVRGAFHILPQTPGEVLPSTDFKEIEYTALTNLSPDTIYTVSIDTTLRSKHGGRLPSRYVFSFLTAPGPTVTGLQVYYTYPANGDSLVMSDDIVQANFSQALDTSTARTAFSIDPPIAGLITFPYGSAMRFSPITSFALATWYRVTIAGSITSQSGVQLSTPYSFMFRTEPFRVRQTSPYDGQTHVSTALYSISVSASDTVDTSSIAKAFSISPIVAGTFSTYTNNTSFSFYPSSRLQSYTVYSVTVSDSLKSKSGLHSPAAYTFSFATGQ